MDNGINDRDKRKGEHNLYSTEAMNRRNRKRKQLKISMQLKMFQIPMLGNFCQSASTL